MAPDQQSGLAIVAVFLYPHEAELARARLESGGLAAWVLDGHPIGMDWQLCAALGGIKVAVAPEDATRARELLSEDFCAALLEIEEEELPATAAERCPACAAERTIPVQSPALPTLTQGAISGLFLTLGFVVPRRRVRVERRCASCAHVWSVVERR